MNIEKELEDSLIKTIWLLTVKVELLQQQKEELEKKIKELEESIDRKNNEADLPF